MQRSRSSSQSAAKPPDPLFSEPDSYHTWAETMKWKFQMYGMSPIVADAEPLDALAMQGYNTAARGWMLDRMAMARKFKHVARARDIWMMLKATYACGPCKVVKEGRGDYVEALRYREMAKFGCPSCHLLVCCIEAVAPGWIDGSKLKSISVSTREPFIVVLLREDLKNSLPSTREFELFINGGHQACLPNLASGIEVEPNMFSDVPLSQATDWLRDCVTEHTICSIPNPQFKPRRLLCLGGYDHDSNISIIDTTEDITSDTISYCALSYCWGPVSNTLVTTTQNLELHRRSVQLLLMPQTIQDAVVVCRNLRIRYLWVDALCILQDDIGERDWYEQSGQMREVYSNALLTIAVDASPSCTSGFLAQYHDRLSNWHTLDSVCTKDQQHVRSLVRQKLKSAGSDAWDKIMVSPLSKRGWALQESILPNRILHFTGQEVVWECNSLCQREFGDADYNQIKLINRTLRIATQAALKPSSAIPAPLTSQAVSHADDENESSTHITDFLIQGSEGSVFWAWLSIVEHYSVRDLTQVNDKLSALSGLASLVQERLGKRGGTYLAGLWEGDFARGLLWYVNGPGEPHRASKYRAPSWSWASMDGAIQYFKEHYQFMFVSSIKLSEAVCTVSPLDPTGRVTAGRVILRAKLVPALLSIFTAPLAPYWIQYTGKAGCAGHAHHDQFVYVQNMFGNSRYEVLLDERVELESKVASGRAGYFCLEVGSTLDVRTGFARTWWLVLRGLERTEGVYERIGIGYCHVGEAYEISLFDDSKKVTVTLI